MTTNVGTCKHGNLLTQSQAVAFIQLECGGRLYCMGCFKIGTLNDPIDQLNEVICRDAATGEFYIAGHTRQPGEFIETTWEQYLFCNIKAWFESLNCPFRLYVAYICCGRREDINNRARVHVVDNARITERVYSEGMSFDSDETVRLSGTLRGGLKLRTYHNLLPVPVTQNATIESFFSITACDHNDGKACSQTCTNGSYCGRMYAVGSNGALVISNNEGRSWGLSPNAPIMGAISSVFCCNGRVIIFPADSADMPHYSDDGAATWTPVTASFFTNLTVYPNTVTKLGNGQILAGTYTGQVIASQDNGGSWSTQFVSAFSQTPIVGIAEHTNGVYALHEDGTLIYSTDGDDWMVCASLPPGTWRSLSSNCCSLWAGNEEGQLMYNNATDPITAWQYRQYGIAGAVRSTSWDKGDRYHGFMTAGTRVYETIDGGQIWKCIYDSGNVMLWDVHVCSDCQVLSLIHI